MRAKFEQLGAGLVRMDIMMGMFIHDAERGAALQWLAEAERKQARKDWWMLILTAVAAIGAVIAAAPILKAWF